MRNNRRNNRKKAKAKRAFIILIGVIIISIVGITKLLGNIEGNTFDVNAQIVKDDTNEKEVEENISKNNSGYLSLEEDVNADDASIVLPESMYKWNFYREDGKKIVYLTFDDGPSTEVTTKILDILDANDVKATFFVLGDSIENNPKSIEILKRMAKNGHAIANHGYSHNYDILYPNDIIDVNAFMNDMDKNLQLLKNILGEDFNTRVVRMPGGYGSWNPLGDSIKSLNEALSAKGYYQTDWNALNGDAEGQPKNAEQQLEELKKTMKDYDTLIVLMHDTNAKENTVEYLQSAIDYLKAEGFEFKILK